MRQERHERVTEDKYCLRMSCHFVIPDGLYGCVILVRSVIYVQIRDSQGCKIDIVSECQQYAGLGFDIF